VSPDFLILLLKSLLYLVCVRVYLIIFLHPNSMGTAKKVSIFVACYFITHCNVGCEVCVLAPCKHNSINEFNVFRVRALYHTK
jgi:hypothetical protein